MSKNNQQFQTGIQSQEAPDFRGYTMEELKHQRALTLIKREFLKQKAMNDVDAFKSRLPFNRNSPMGNINAKGLLGKVMKGLSYADYLMLGFSIFSAGRKIFSLFHKRRR